MRGSLRCHSQGHPLLPGLWQMLPTWLLSAHLASGPTSICRLKGLPKTAKLIHVT